MSCPTALLFRKLIDAGVRSPCCWACEHLTVIQQRAAPPSHPIFACERYEPCLWGTNIARPDSEEIGETAEKVATYDFQLSVHLSAQARRRSICWLPQGRI